jgi:hypothetical protein
MADLKISALTASTTPLAGTEVLPIVQSGTTKQVSVANLTAGRAVSASTLGAGVTTPVSIVEASSTTPVITASQSSTSVAIDTLIGAFNAYSYDGTINSKGGVGGVRVYSEATWNTGGTPSYLAFYTHPGSANNDTLLGAVVEAGRFDSSGNLKVAIGNVVIGTSGKGIDFSATSGSGTSELLNDYEEGDWTPVPTSGSGSITSYTSSGRYTKTGRIVVLVAEITITNGGTASGLMTISGLPFTSFSGQAQPGIAYDPNITGTSVCVFVNSGATSATVRQFAGTAPLYTNGIAYQFVVTYQV